MRKLWCLGLVTLWAVLASTAVGQELPFHAQVVDGPTEVARGPESAEVAPAPAAASTTEEALVVTPASTVEEAFARDRRQMRAARARLLLPLGLIATGATIAVVATLRYPPIVDCEGPASGSCDGVDMRRPLRLMVAGAFGGTGLVFLGIRSADLVRCNHARRARALIVLPIVLHSTNESIYGLALRGTL